MKQDIPHDLVILCTDDADLDFIRNKDPSITAISLTEAVGLESERVVLVARGEGQETLQRANLGLLGAFLDLGVDGSLEGWMAGREDLRSEIVKNAEDLFWSEERPLSEWTFPEMKDGESCGITGLEDHLRWTDEGELVIVVGPYGCGKSSMTRLLGYHWLREIGVPAGKRMSVCAWEDRGQIIKRELRRFTLNNPKLYSEEIPNVDFGTISDSELNPRQLAAVRNAEQWVGWTERAADESRFLDWYIELVEHRAKRDNVGFFVFDPWNEHDLLLRAGQTETDYVREMMIRLQALARRLKIILVVVTHISAKGYDESGKIKPFRVANAYGSSNFGAKATRGICMLRTQDLVTHSTFNKVVGVTHSCDSSRKNDGTPIKEHMVLRFDKCKNEETMGNLGTVAMHYDPKKMTVRYDNDASTEVAKEWR